MSKIGRNDPCPCGSGKKYKKCCGKNNVIEFNPTLYNNELEQLHEDLIHFSMEQFEFELMKHVQPYIDSYLGEVSSAERDAYLVTVVSWFILNQPIENGRTIFDIFHSRQRDKIKHPRTQKVFSTWSHIKPSVFEIMSIDQQAGFMIVQDIRTHETYSCIYHKAMTDSIENILVGTLLPYVHKYDFLLDTVKVPHEQREQIIELFEQMGINHENIDDFFPEFLGRVFHLNEPQTIEWIDPQHEKVAKVFSKQMTEKSMDDLTIETGVHIWNLYCLRHHPNIQKPGAHAAALDYFIQQTLIEGERSTQAEIAKEYGTTASTVSSNYRKLQKLLEEKDLDSQEKLTAYINTMLNEGSVSSPSDSPRGTIQELSDETEHKRERVQEGLTDQALVPQEDSPDAYLLLAERESNLKKRSDLLYKAVIAGERELGPEFIEEHKGYFWGLTETRPYMRAKAALAMHLEYVGLIEAAIEQYEELLELNPHDNQGIRSLLLPLYIEKKSLEDAMKLLETYKDDMTVTMMFSRALVTYLTEGLTGHTYNLFKQANEQNPYVLDYLLKRKKIPNDIFDDMIVGTENEAMSYAQENMHLWEDAGELLERFEPVSQG